MNLTSSRNPSLNVNVIYQPYSMPTIEQHNKQAIRTLRERHPPATSGYRGDNSGAIP